VARLGQDRALLEICAERAECLHQHGFGDAGTAE